MKLLSKVYEPQKVEDKWYSHWVEKNYFHSEPNSKKKPYTIMIPPPNVTGMLTMGHILNNTLQDILVRKARMEGYETLWLPGTDHAGIATQTKVEKELKKKGKTRYDLGRENFIKLIWEWKEKYGGIIINQLKKLGVSCDWERERFTLDEGLSQAVREVFVDLYNKGLIYKGKRIINWCPVSHTALSDEEVIHKDVNGHFWYFKYPLKENNNEHILIATTRPETMLGDTAIAVNPKDERYKKYIGKTVILPIVNREIPIISDEYVDKEFGTGAVKVTPAHDPNDYEMGKRHDLEFINIMNDDATMNKNTPEKFVGLTRENARKLVVKEMDNLGLLAKVENHQHSVGYSEREDVPVEPLLSHQWFIAMEKLAKPALQVVNEGKVTFNPSRWIKTYNHWLENIKDWCISRQLWWGHRIPVFYCKDCGWESAEKTDPIKCPKCNSKNIYQDKDVLDTWFSSWLWPFSTLGWPEKNKDLDYYYPTDDLVTGPDIIFFWVARMIMAGLEFKDEIPFKNVYFTGIIRDSQGRKMSKSLGNSPDPLDIIAKYGADTLRFGTMLIAPKGQDILFDESQLETGRNFLNKLWNATRFIFMNIDDDDDFSKLTIENITLSTPEKWILSKLQNTVKSVNDNLDNYRFNDASKDIYNFTWNYFCDWYIELIKPSLFAESDTVSQKEKKSSIFVAIYTLKTILKLLHPFTPFITEEIWNSIKNENETDLIVSEWPKIDDKLLDKEIENEMELVMKIITAIRTIRSEMTVPPSKKADVLIQDDSEKYKDILNRNSNYIKSLGKIENLTIDKRIEKPEMSATAVVEKLQIYIPLEGLIDTDKEKERLKKEIASYEGRLKAVQGKLKNPNFVKRAPENIVEHERKKEKSYLESLELLRKNFEKLG
ncbi:MAG: valine--tRNA ligase [Candidatus Marinimicrobia bacterium]|nr:valine--tRNA ligase [Candidatus Neomarinimicrobiota bacterium]